MIDISIIIVNYNVKEFIIPCIKSIIDYSPNNLSIEIIVVDNNSNDESVISIATKFPNTKLILNDKNIGFSKGVNKGAKAADGKYLYILNPDTELLDDNFTQLIKVIEINNNIAVLGPAIYSKSNKLQRSYWRKPSLYNTLLSIMNLEFFNWMKNYNGFTFNNPTEVESISGAAFFVNASLFNSIGGFDPKLFWMEDIDFCIRISKMGYKTYYLPACKVLHYRGKSSEKNWTDTIINQLMSKIKYFYKHHSPLETNILKIAIFNISVIKSLLFLIIAPISIKYRNKLYGYVFVIKKILLNDY